MLNNQTRLQLLDMSRSFTNARNPSRGVGNYSSIAVALLLAAPIASGCSTEESSGTSAFTAQRDSVDCNALWNTCQTKAAAALGTAVGTIGGIFGSASSGIGVLLTGAGGATVTYLASGDATNACAEYDAFCRPSTDAYPPLSNWHPTASCGVNAKQACYEMVFSYYDHNTYVGSQPVSCGRAWECAAGGSRCPVPGWPGWGPMAAQCTDKLAECETKTLAACNAPPPPPLKFKGGACANVPDTLIFNDSTFGAWTLKYVAEYVWEGTKTISLPAIRTGSGEVYCPAVSLPVTIKDNKGFVTVGWRQSATDNKGCPDPNGTSWIEPDYFSGAEHCGPPYSADGHIAATLGLGPNFRSQDSYTITAAQ